MLRCQLLSLLYVVIVQVLFRHHAFQGEDTVQCLSRLWSLGSKNLSNHSYMVLSELWVYGWMGYRHVNWH